MAQGAMPSALTTGIAAVTPVTTVVAAVVAEAVAAASPEKLSRLKRRADQRAAAAFKIARSLQIAGEPSSAYLSSLVESADGSQARALAAALHVPASVAENAGGATIPHADGAMAALAPGTVQRAVPAESSDAFLHTLDSLNFRL